MIIGSQNLYLPAGVMDVSYRFEESETEPTNMLGAALDPDSALNTSIKTKLTEAPAIKHRLKLRPCIDILTLSISSLYSGNDCEKLAWLYKYIMSQHDKTVLKSRVLSTRY